MMTHDGVVFRGLWHCREIELIACYIYYTRHLPDHGVSLDHKALLLVIAAHRLSLKFEHFLTLVWSPLIQPYIHIDVVSPLVNRH
jgi:hypothetical protein